MTVLPFIPKDPTSNLVLEPTKASILHQPCYWKHKDCNRTANHGQEIHIWKKKILAYVFSWTEPFYLTVLKKQIATSSYDLLMIWVFSDCEIQLTAIWKWVSSFWSPCHPTIPKSTMRNTESSNWWGGMLGNSRKGKKWRTFWGKHRQGKPEAFWWTPFPDPKNSIYIKTQNPQLSQ